VGKGGRIRFRDWSIGIQLMALVGIVAGPATGAAYVIAGHGGALAAWHVAALVVVAIAGVVVGVFLAGALSARVRRLAEAAEEIAEGSRAARLPSEGHDEIAQLARVLNRMLDRAHRARDELERAVHDHREALELQRSILDNAGEYAVLSDDLSGRIVSANRGAVAILGLQDPSQLIGRRFFDFLAPEEVASGRSLEMLQTTRRERTWSGNAWCQRLDGVLFPGSIRVAPRRDGTGRIVGRVVLLRDISREQQAEHRYRDLFHSLQEAVYVTTREGRFLEANGAFARLIGCASVDEARQLRAQDLYIDGADRESWLRALERDGAVRDLEVRLRRRDGAILTCIESSRALRGPDGRTECYLGTLVDVTERRALQRKLERTQRMEAVGTLAGGLAHDFNNILAAIVPNAELIENSEETPARIRERARTIRAAAQRAGGITRQLLSFAREDRSARNAVDLNQVVRESVRLLEPGLPEGARLETNLAAGLPAVRGDAAQLQQVVVNLVLNARDALEGPGTIRVSTRSVDADEALCRGREGLRPGLYGVLSVEDDGVGMTPEQQERIFEPFYTTKASGLGTGLGLSVVYGIVTGCQGHVSVASEPGKGSRFDIYLPAAGVLEPSLEAPPGRARPQASGVALVVDDDEALRSETSVLLSKLGWQAIAVQSAGDAVEIFRARHDAIDLVLVDYVLAAGWSGVAMARALRRIDRSARIVFTGGPGRREEAMLVPGAVAYVVKPVDEAELAGVLAAAAHRTAAGA
jgi:two-component system cell cycle sensor histidine kinase/response regulator CckA